MSLTAGYESGGVAACMAPYSCGVDIIELDTIARALELGGDRFLERVYTRSEQAYCHGRVAQLAGRFAAKEAIAKALGTGIDGLSWVEIEILSDTRGKPYVHLHGAAASRASALHLVHWSVSVSHARTHAVAFAVASR